MEGGWLEGSGGGGWLAGGKEGDCIGECTYLGRELGAFGVVVDGSGLGF